MVGEVKQGAGLVNRLSTTNKAVATLSQKLKRACEEDDYLTKQITAMDLGTLIKMQGKYTVSNNMDRRMQVLIDNFWGSETKVIEEQVCELQSILATAQTTMKLAYEHEFSGAHHRLGSTIVDLMRDQIEEKAGVGDKKKSKKACHQHQNNPLM